MEWWQAFLYVLGGLIFLLMTGLPVAFSFLVINIIALFFIAGPSAWSLLTVGTSESLMSFSLVPVPMFLLMGEILYHSGLMGNVIEGVDRWVGQVPGRLSVLAVSVGTVFAAMSGSGMASTAVLGSTLLPEMRKRGYSKLLSLGPIMGAGGLAVIIPPSALAVILAALAQVSPAKVLVGGIIPGLIIAASFIAYILVMAITRPHLAPRFQSPPAPLSVKLVKSVHLIPVFVIIFLVLGLIFLGVATPSEAAAVGATGSIVLAAAYGKLNFQVLKKSFIASTRICGMMLLIIAGSTAFGYVLAMTQATQGLLNYVTQLPFSPFLIIVAMQIAILLCGSAMDEFSLMMISVPIFLPVVKAFGFDPVWFCVVLLVNIEAASLSPPTGYILFIMKGVAKDVTMGDIYRAVTPFFLVELITVAIMLFFPDTVLLLPGLLTK